MKRIAVYPGSFDPITNGHVDICQRALEMFDKVVVAIAENVRKAPLFTVEERKKHILAAVGNDRVEVDAFEGLLVDYVKKRGARVVVRGLRALADFEYEFQLAHMNRRLGAGQIETIFLMTSEKDFYVASSLVKEVAQFGGSVRGLVPDGVAAALEKKFRRKS